MNRFVILTLATTLFFTPPVAFANDRNRWSDRGHRYDRYDRPWGQSYGRWDGGHDRYTQRGYYGNPFGYGRGPSSYNDDNAVRWGISSGRLSRNEVRDLESDAAAIRRKEQRYMTDGRLSNSEREDLRDDRRAYYDSLQHNLNDGERRW